MRTIDEPLEGLEDLPRPPDPLFAVGALPARPALAIVGTRRADPDAVVFARRLAARVAAARVDVVSGGAEGIDAAAHRGALDGGGRTFVVQAAALDDPYPRRNRPLFDAVLEAGGGWLGETPSGETNAPWRFLARNRIIAALSDAVLVVQAPFKSGALNTARWALELGRPLFVVPAAPWDRRSAGGARLLKGEARPCLDADDLAEALGVSFDGSPSSADPPELAGDLAKVYAALSARPRHVDEIAALAELPATRATVALVQLQVRGLVEARAAGWRVAGGARRRLCP